MKLTMRTCLVTVFFVTSTPDTFCAWHSWKRYQSIAMVTEVAAGASDRVFFYLNFHFHSIQCQQIKILNSMCMCGTRGSQIHQIVNRKHEQWRKKVEIIIIHSTNPLVVYHLTGQLTSPAGNHCLTVVGGVYQLIICASWGLIKEKLKVGRDRLCTMTI